MDINFRILLLEVEQYWSYYFFTKYATNAIYFYNSTNLITFLASKFSSYI
ncbi:Uncharacterised protein [Pseudomonas putida]|nr:Uncharacterised protein [Pseudomonas putida]CAB5718753.1 Uncharacterised protein [Aeromonas hydrophila]